jgi:hypothetical protein
VAVKSEGEGGAEREGRGLNLDADADVLSFAMRVLDLEGGKGGRGEVVDTGEVEMC